MHLEDVQRESWEFLMWFGNMFQVWGAWQGNKSFCGSLRVQSETKRGCWAEMPGTCLEKVFVWDGGRNCENHKLYDCKSSPFFKCKMLLQLFAKTIKWFYARIGGCEHLQLKGAWWSNFSEWSFLLNDASSPLRVLDFKFQLKQSDQ